MLNKYSNDEHPDDFCGDLYEERQIEKESKKMSDTNYTRKELQSIYMQKVNAEYDKLEKEEKVNFYTVAELHAQLEYIMKYGGSDLRTNVYQVNDCDITELCTNHYIYFDRIREQTLREL